jgi:predicted AAA+ superfamily ATPase
VPRTTIQEYFQVLFDTLVARALPAWRRSAKRKAITTSKLYFFDTGVVRLLRNEGTIRERSPAFGAAFESYMFHELQTFADYTGKGPLAYWRSTANHEVDFILGDSIAIEVKGKAVIDGADMAGLKALREEGLMRHFILACLAERPRTVEGITILPWKDLLDRLWDGELD